MRVTSLRSVVCGGHVAPGKSASYGGWGVEWWGDASEAGDPEPFSALALLSKRRMLGNGGWFRPEVGWKDSQGWCVKSNQFQSKRMEEMEAYLSHG
jgi:hypothetical protein